MNNLKPLFSIIIPTFNHAHFIGRCLDSVLSQTYQNWEAIVVNNFSTDNTVEIVESYNDSRIKLVNNANGGIIAVSRNKGISESKGDWICFLDSDDWWYSNKLEVSLKYIDKSDLIYHNLDKYFTLNNAKGKVYGRELHSGSILKDLLINSNGIPNSSVVIRREVVEAVGFISEDKDLIAVEDSDYWLRVAIISNKFKFINQSLGAYWIGENMSVSEKQIQRETNLFDKYKHILEPIELSIALSNLAFRKSRIYHKLGKFKEAKSYYLLSIKNSELKVKLKAIYGLCLVFFEVRI